MSGWRFLSGLPIDVIFSAGVTRWINVPTSSNSWQVIRLRRRYKTCTLTVLYAFSMVPNSMDPQEYECTNESKNMQLPHLFVPCTDFFFCSPSLIQHKRTYTIIYYPLYYCHKKIAFSALACVPGGIWGPGSRRGRKLSESFWTGPVVLMGVAQSYTMKYFFGQL